MDNLTHSLFGLTLARTPLSRAGRGSTVALLLASNAPDIDVVTTADGALRYLEWHRGPTHGPFGLVGLGLLCAALVWLGNRWWKRASPKPPPRFRWLWLISMVGVLFHVLMDLPTSYGTRPFSPFAWTWLTLDWLPIIDIYLLAVLASGLWLGRRAPARYAAIVLALCLAFYGLRGTMHHAAMVNAPAAFGAPLPAPCDDAVPAGGVVDYWPRQTLHSPRDQGARVCRREIAAMPDLLSPFRWRLIAQLSNGYEVREVNLLDRFSADRAPTSVGRRVSEVYPSHWTPAVVQASSSNVGRVFLGFSRFPAARSLREADGRTIVRWTDLRFTSGARAGSRRNSTLFSAMVEVAPDGTILNQRLGP